MTKATEITPKRAGCIYYVSLAGEAGFRVRIEATDGNIYTGPQYPAMDEAATVMNAMRNMLNVYPTVVVHVSDAKGCWTVTKA